MQAKQIFAQLASGLEHIHSRGCRGRARARARTRAKSTATERRYLLLLMVYRNCWFRSAERTFITSEVGQCRRRKPTCQGHTTCSFRSLLRAPYGRARCPTPHPTSPTRPPVCAQSLLPVGILHRDFNGANILIDHHEATLAMTITMRRPWP